MMKQVKPTKKVDVAAFVKELLVTDKVILDKLKEAEAKE